VAKKAKGFGVDTYLSRRRVKRPGRHSKQHKNINKGQGKPI
jgi:hypothetical protein